MTVEQLKADGFYFYCFTTEDQREAHRARLFDSGVIYEMYNVSEEVAGHTILMLAVKQVSLTRKQQLGKFPRGD